MRERQVERIRRGSSSNLQTNLNNSINIGGMSVVKREQQPDVMAGNDIASVPNVMIKEAGVPLEYPFLSSPGMYKTIVSSLLRCSLCVHERGHFEVTWYRHIG